MHWQSQTHNNKTITQHLNSHILYDQPVVIGVSWWCDSMYLLHQLKTFWNKKKYNPDNIHVIFCHHHTRPEIDDELEIVQKYRSNIPITIRHYHGGKYSEESLRKRRHKEFINYCHSIQSQILFLGHHLDDRIESSILNLQRWCGINGLLTLKVATPHFLNDTITIVRPLLSCTKSFIQQQCNDLHIPYNNDLSNTDPTISQRNRIRKEIAQYLQQGKIYTSIERIYTTLDTLLSTTQNTIDDNYQHITINANKYLMGITAGQRTEEKLYHIYRLHHIIINPRTSTLKQLSQQLLNSGNSIHYAWLHITAYTYWSTIQKDVKFL